MIIPLRLPNGLPDLAHLSEWTAICDRCSARRPIGECSKWAIGHQADSRIYCPPCVRVVAAELLGAVLPSVQLRVSAVIWRFIAAVHGVLNRKGVSA
jgi:hypothetical protein